MLRLSPVEFAEMRLGDFFLKLIGHRQEQLHQNKFIGETMRRQTFYIMKSISSNNYKEPEDVWKFGWEDEEKDVINREAGKIENVKNMISLLK